MRKIFVLFLTIFVMALFSAPVFAGSDTETNATDELLMGASVSSDNATTVKLSQNVHASYKSEDNATTNTYGVNYSASTYNPLGIGRSYGTASDTTTIYYSGTTTTPATAVMKLKNGNAGDVDGNTPLGQ